MDNKYNFQISKNEMTPERINSFISQHTDPGLTCEYCKKKIDMYGEYMDIVQIPPWRKKKFAHSICAAEKLTEEAREACRAYVEGVEEAVSVLPEEEMARQKFDKEISNKEIPEEQS